METDIQIGLGDFLLLDQQVDSQRWLLSVSNSRSYILSKVEGVDKNIRGVTCSMHDSFGIKHRVGYYSAHQCKNIDAPDYSKSQFFFIDGKLFGLSNDRLKLKISQGFLTRKFTVKIDGNLIVNIKYPWIFFREWSVRGDYNYISRDIFYGLMGVVKYAHPDWLNNSP